jgi:MerR family mercuric resistance operon transcriptional regulator
MTARICGGCASSARRRRRAFTLDEIGELLSLDASEDRARAHELATARIAALDAKIAELQGAKRWLARLADDCGRLGKGPCPILTAFEGEGGGGGRGEPARP